jgi:pilus assembly protein CpaF
MSPNRIVVGEVRGGEALDMLQAMNTRLDGSLSTGHANSSRDMMKRLTTMVLQGSELPLSAIESMIASAIEIVVHLGRPRDHKRRGLEISEVIGIEQNDTTTAAGIRLETLFRYDDTRGTLVKTSELRRHYKLDARL